MKMTSNNSTDLISDRLTCITPQKIIIYLTVLTTMIQMENFLIPKYLEKTPIQDLVETLRSYIFKMVKKRKAIDFISFTTKILSIK